MPEIAFVIGFIGNKTSNYDGGRKGLDTLEIAMRELGNRVPNLHVCFLGLGWDEEVASISTAGHLRELYGIHPAEFASRILFRHRRPSRDFANRRRPGHGAGGDGLRDGGRNHPCGIGAAHCSGRRKWLFRRDRRRRIHSPSASRSLGLSPVLLESIGKAARAAVYPHRSWTKFWTDWKNHWLVWNLAPLALPQHSSPASAKTAAQLAGAVHTMDGLLWGLMSWWQGLLSPAVAGRMVNACWEGYDAADVLRGVGLITRSWFRPAWLQNGPTI